MFSFNNDYALFGSFTNDNGSVNRYCVSVVVNEDVSEDFVTCFSFVSRFENTVEEWEKDFDNLTVYNGLKYEKCSELVEDYPENFTIVWSEDLAPENLSLHDIEDVSLVV